MNAATRKSRPASGPAKSLPHRVRIIGGRWRGVPIPIPALPAIRPSPDRVRETLFNWLQQRIVSARCLDLFAGSGVLGLEALSRGAQQVEFVDSEPAVGMHLSATLAKLQAIGGTVHVADALRFIEQPPRPFDIVFLDPPYASDLLEQVAQRLAQGWLAPDALIYLECPANRPLPQVPATWSMHRSKRAGQVGYHLLRAMSHPTSPSSSLAGGDS